ncbi:MAG: hypothetical protein AB1758_17500, partial [Candidatus Eremiobacterota bacterium]
IAVLAPELTSVAPERLQPGQLRLVVAGLDERLGQDEARAELEALLEGLRERKDAKFTTMSSQMGRLPGTLHPAREAVLQEVGGTRQVREVLAFFVQPGRLVILQVTGSNDEALRELAEAVAPRRPPDRRPLRR